MVTRPENSNMGRFSEESLLEQIHIATVNVRNGHQWSPPADPKNVFAEKPWSERKSRLVDALLSTGPLDILGCQEVFHDQLQDLQELLGETYSHVGSGRDDGKQGGEYSPIFFDCTKFELVRWSTMWLSRTPNVPGSKGWDAALPRIATLLTLRYKDKDKGGELIHAVNTHYDHLGVRARAESSLLIRSAIWHWVHDVERKEKPPVVAPVVFFGDFNSPPQEDGYKNITSLHPLPSDQPSFTFLDSFTNLLTSSSSSAPDFSTIIPLQTRPYGPHLTYTDFAPPGARNATRIDFVMLGAEVDNNDPAERGKSRGGWMIVRYACVDNWVEGDVEGWNGRWSDHRAVRVTIAKRKG
ncbi:endonuclease/exonuclease/phosphatase [Cryptococcus neoformans Bt63]|nr:endonuclease/exonuclease/phosphatase [Cryptococcus neoformans var. grubii Bt63]